MRKKLVAGNWKMNKLHNEAVELISELKNTFTSKSENHLLAIVPPAVYLNEAAQLTADSSILCGVQNCHHKSDGAFTGELSAPMIQSCGAQMVILGHSERRSFFHETDSIISEKLKAVLQQGLTPILCCGEVQEEREAGKFFEVIKKQLTESMLDHISAEEATKIIIAYEPVWAIGTGLTASPEQAQEVHAYIRSLLTEKYGADIASEMTILYGGSCKSSNAEELFGCPDIDGGLIGGASLVAEEFLKIYDCLS